MNLERGQPRGGQEASAGIGPAELTQQAISRAGIEPGAALAGFGSSLWRLGGALQPLLTLPAGTAPYDLLWAGSGDDLLALAGSESGSAGTLWKIDPQDRQLQALATRVSCFTIIP